MSLQWCHNGCDGVSNHRCLDCLFNRLFRRRSKKTPVLRATGLCDGNSPVTGGFRSQRKMFPFDDVFMFVVELYFLGQHTENFRYDNCFYNIYHISFQSYTFSSNVLYIYVYLWLCIYNVYMHIRHHTCFKVENSFAKCLRSWQY